MLRAFRIAAELGFDITRETLQEIGNTAAQINLAAGERIRDEWIKLLEVPHSHHKVKQMDEYGLLTAIFPELEPLKQSPGNIHHRFDAFTHSLETFRHLEHAIGETSRHCRKN
jgi:poly(A) polymerase